MEVLLVLVIVAALLALGYAAFNFASVKKMDEGNARMSEIAEAIRVGANAFITYEYKIIAVVVAIIAVGYRVNSKQATDFRIWATNSLKEYIKKDLF